MASKTKIDKSGKLLSDFNADYDETMLELDLVFDEYRKSHLEPLTRLTLELQGWLQGHYDDYYIAQRLKRKPQILRKLRRFSVRLTQLQDIGGCRVIVDKNQDVNALFHFIMDRLEASDFVKVVRKTDYREKGRDDTGYRALHVILEISGCMLELQLRSKIQHYWSESIERTSVLYGKRLKEKEGDAKVIEYFKKFSDALHEIETSNAMSSRTEIDLQESRELAEAIIHCSTNGKAISGFVNEGVIKSMTATEQGNASGFNNWVLVFDWSDGNFVTWEMVGRNPDQAVAAYLRYEAEFTEDDLKEVVMIGSPNISTVQHTHSHYFGIDHHNAALEGMEKSIIGLSSRSKIDTGARRILMTMRNRRFWGPKRVEVATLRNHFCSNIASFDASLEELRKLDLILGTGPISLDIKKKRQIDDLI